VLAEEPPVGVDLEDRSLIVAARDDVVVARRLVAQRIGHVVTLGTEV
jgi:hypothetical protein